jgi:hypothetical protein
MLHFIFSPFLFQQTASAKNNFVVCLLFRRKSLFNFFPVQSSGGGGFISIDTVIEDIPVLVTYFMLNVSVRHPFHLRFGAVPSH